MANNATVQSKTEGDKKLTTVAFTVPGRFKVNAIVNDRNLVEKVESWTTNPVLGDMLVETTYADYQDFSGVKFPTKITQKTGGFPSLDLTVSDVQPNAAVDIQVPDNVRQAAVRVQAQQVSDGIWYLAGGTHHSVLMEMKDYVVVVEGPQNDERAIAVIAEVKKLVPTKPIKYVVNKPIKYVVNRITTSITPADWARSWPRAPRSSRTPSTSRFSSRPWLLHAP